jgi:hypothetical protein
MQVLVALVLWAQVVAPPAAPVPAVPPPPPPLGKSGVFGKGINVELVSLGAVQAFSAGGAEGGAGVATTLQLDLGPRWALRLPLSLDVTVGHAHGGFADLSFTPGLLRRWRSSPTQRWVPYAGAGVKLGSFGAGRELLGLPVVTTSALHYNEHAFGFHGGHADDPNFEVELGVAPELWAGVEYHISRWFSLDIGATYAWIRVSGENVHLVRELFGVRFSL